MRPFGQTEKAIDLELQIEPWLPADNRTACCVRIRWKCHANEMNLGNGNITTLVPNTLAGRQKDFLRSFQSRAKCFFLTSPLIERANRPSLTNVGPVKLFSTTS